MTTFAGNICLALAALIASALYSPTFRLKPAGGNDEGATGYMMIVVIIIHLAFLLFLFLSSMAIARNGGFDWISANGFRRKLVVGIGLLAAVITSISCALIRLSPDSVPDWTLRLMAFAYAAIPVVLVASGFMLLNGYLRDSVPSALYKWPLTAVFAVSLAGASVSLFVLFSEISRSAASRRQEIQAMEDGAHQDHLNYIDSCDVRRDFTSLLTYTHADRAPDLREKALAKIKSDPAWQQKLIYWLENKGAREVFTFLADNEVDDKKLLAEPVKEGVLSIATSIKETISYKTHPSHTSPHEFMSDVNISLRTVDKFEGLGVDYLSAVKDLKAALQEPSPIGVLRFDCVADLDRWIAKH